MVVVVVVGSLTDADSHRLLALERLELEAAHTDHTDREHWLGDLAMNQPTIFQRGSTTSFMERMSSDMRSADCL